MNASQSKPSSTTPHTDRERRGRHTERLVERLRSCEDHQRQPLQEELVLANLGLADAIASRYTGRGVPLEDLQQVAYLALVRTTQKFDPDAGHSFFSYAVPTLRGEVRRHFRDHGWMVRPPRRIQELQGRIAQVESALSSTVGRSPTARELAMRLGEPVEDVREAMRHDGAFTPVSLDRTVVQGGSAPLVELLGSTDPVFEEAEARMVLAPAISTLSERDRYILLLRFFHGRTQQEVGEEIGVTQMQVSRILARIFADLRRVIEVDEGWAG